MNTAPSKASLWIKQHKGLAVKKMTSPEHRSEVLEKQQKLFETITLLSKQTKVGWQESMVPVTSM